MFILVNNYRPF